MSCERFRVLVSDLIAGVDLPEADGFFRGHVGACEDCTIAVSSMTRIADMAAV